MLLLSNGTCLMSASAQLLPHLPIFMPIAEGSGDADRVELKRVVCLQFPLFYKKPQEFLQTGFFRYFLYTWAFFPRKADPQMTFASRLLCTVVCTLVGLMVLMVLGNSGVKYQGMRSGSDIELAGEAYRPRPMHD
jgi:hypothetical protein